MAGGYPGGGPRPGSCGGAHPSETPARRGRRTRQGPGALDAAPGPWSGPTCQSVFLAGTARGSVRLAVRARGTRAEVVSAVRRDRAGVDRLVVVLVGAVVGAAAG